MKVTPMLFNDEMVRAIVDDRKTQTRRIVKADIPDNFCRGYVAAITNGERWAIARSILNPEGAAAFPPDPEPGFLCPYGKPGDLIYIKETHAFSRLFDLMPPRDVPVGSDVYYKATMSEQEFHDLCAITRQSIFMRRWASRLTLKIKSIRLEQLQNISRDDAKAEGIEIARYAADRTPLYRHYQYSNIPDSNPVASFESLWESINGNGSWNANPWVWRIEYEPIMQNVDVYLSELEEAA